jgi:hypothetical protein
MIDVRHFLEEHFMRRRIPRIIVTLAAAAAALTMAGTSAQAAPPTKNPEQGLVFLSKWASDAVVAYFPTVDGGCTAFPAAATVLIGYSGVSDVRAWRTADCSGQETGLGTLVTFSAGEYGSFKAFPQS